MILPGSKAMTGRTSLDLLAAAAAFTTLVLWASAFPGIRAGLRAYTPGHLALLRYLVASTGLLACGVPARVRVPARRDLPRLAFLGLAGIAAYNEQFPRSASFSMEATLACVSGEYTARSKHLTARLSENRVECLPYEETQALP